MDPYYGCVLLPLGSPTAIPKRSYVHVPVVPGSGMAVHDPWMCVLGGCLGRGITGGWGGVYRVRGSTTQPPRAEVQTRTSEAGPGSPMGLEWVGTGLDRPLRVSQYRCASGPRTTHSGHKGLRGPLRCPGTSLRAKRRDSMTFPIKLVKTTECHQKSPKRPVIVPVFQNGSGKSPLDFPGFLFWPAFSHKELMGLF